MNNHNKDNQQPIRLGSLYPMPKTYDEQREYRKAVAQRQYERQPKYLPFWPVVNISLVLLVVVVMLMHSEVVLRLGALGSLAAMALLGAMLVIFVGWQVMRLSDFFGQKGNSSIPFFVTYLVSVGPIVLTCHTLFSSVLSWPLIYGILLLVNAGLLYGLAALVMTAQLSDVHKLTTLVVICILSIAAAVTAELSR